jgi:hypothetical protein
LTTIGTNQHRIQDKFHADYIKEKHATFHSVPNISSLSLICEVVLCLLYVKMSQSVHLWGGGHSGKYLNQENLINGGMWKVMRSITVCNFDLILLMK